MKSSLKFTAIALLLGGVLHIQSLDAACTEYSLDTLSELSQETGRFSGEQGPKIFAAYVEKLIDTIDKDVLKQELIKQISSSSLPIRFFEDAQASVTNKPKVKGCLSYCVGAKAGILSTNKKNQDIIISLQTEINKLSDEIELLQDDVYEAHQQLQSPGVHAFSVLSEQSEVVPGQLCSLYLAIEQKTSSLPIAEQVYFLNIRRYLTSPVDLAVSLNQQLDSLLKCVRNIACDTNTADNLTRASFLVNIIPQMRGIVPIIGEYLQSILGQIQEVNKAATKSAWGGLSTSIQPDALQVLQIRELDVRKTLAYAAFDALFGVMIKPSTVPAATSFVTDQSPTNILASKIYTLHGTLPSTSASQKLVVKSDGSISMIDDAVFLTGIDLNSEFMINLRTATTNFLAKMLGAQALLKTSTLAEVSELPGIRLDLDVIDDDSEHKIIEKELPQTSSEEELNEAALLTTSGANNVANEEV